MIKRKRTRVRSHPLGDPRPGDTHEYRWKVGNRWCELGDPVKVRGRRGTFKAVRLVHRDGVGSWVDVWDAGGAWRSVREEEVRLAPKKRSK